MSWSAAQRMRRPRLAVTLGAALIGAACGAEKAFNPSEVAGLYPIIQVDGHDLGWYHHLGYVDCQVAFIDGKLTLSANGVFDLDLVYNVRCFGPDPFDGSGRLRILGNSMSEENELVILRGSGPNLIAGGADNWTLEVRRDDPYITLRFVGFYRDFWADPVLTMGPRQ